MSEEYFRRTQSDEARRAFAMECVLKAIGEEGTKLTQGREGIAERIVERAKVFENYLKG